MRKPGFPKKQGLYDPAFEHDACGVGFVCNIKGKKSHELVRKALDLLKRLEHRGAVGADPLTGDGAGILIQMPDEFMQGIAKENSIDLPELGKYGTGLVFLPQDEKERAKVKKDIEKFTKEAGQNFLGWREIPVDNKVIGESARETEPVIEQVFIGAGADVTEVMDLERKLYVIRKQIELKVRESRLKEKGFFYVTNLSCRTFSFKGLLMTAQVEAFFKDLDDKRITSALALVHSRYSTNTFPTWDLAQPFRYLAHNGEINTLRGNVNWMKAREASLAHEVFGDDIEKLKPIITPNVSDSASFDNAFELLTLSGRSLAHSLLMLCPSAWEQNKHMDKKVKDFYKYHACFMEPWDGPAALAVTDGRSIGAVLDRNGLRPARYLVTKDDMVIMASEVGTLDTDPKNILKSGRLEPGKIFFIDTEEGRIIEDDEIKKAVASDQPYSKWVKEYLVELEDLKAGKKTPKMSEDVDTMMKAFGYTREDLKTIIKPMAELGKEPTGSMGADVPQAVLSEKPKLLYNYIKQLFAQVTNPAIDPIREEIVMGLDTFVGQQKNLLAATPEHCHKVHVKDPVLTNDELAKLKDVKEAGFKTKTISILFDAGELGAFQKKLDEICDEALKAIDEGYTFVVLSDRGVTKDKIALPALLATGAVHHHLVKNAVRTQIGILVESAEPREVHHFAVLFGYGADCVNPYLAYEVLEYLVKGNELDMKLDAAIKNYRKAIDAGVKKILSKIGISTLNSYRGAQIYEIIGLHDDVVNKAFVGTSSRIGGADMEIVEEETRMRHASAYPEDIYTAKVLPSGGVYQWKKDGEYHLWNPDSIAALQDSTRENDYDRFKEFTSLIDNQEHRAGTLRGMLKFKKTEAISIDEVETEEEIVKRFVTGAMSFGSISKGAHETLAIAMNRLGGQSNTGEGGENPARFTPLPNGDSARSAIKQVASGRFGVCTNYLVNADEIQIKIAQGAKPGEGGQLPGHKVSEIIAQTRFTTPGVTLISPPPHHDIYSIEDLAQLIYDLKNTNPRARISVKLVSEIGVGTVAAGVAKGHADMILISGGDGGTGASPLSSVHYAGLPFELGLSETHQTLVLNDLRSRVRLQTDGQMRTGRDVIVAAILGAEEYGFCSAALIVMGCVMLRHCHLNNCSLGVATQDPLLESRFKGKVDSVINYMMFLARDVREHMANLGVRKIDDLIGRTDLVQLNKKILPWKAKKLDLSKVLYKPEVPASVGIFKTKDQDHGIDDVLDRKLIKLAKPALKDRKEVEIESTINNYNRTTGAMLGGEVCANHGDSGLPDDTIKVNFKGMAGQSFGAFLSHGITFKLEGIANDYVGKGISGGKIIIHPDKTASYKAEENVIIGNTTFYGAIRGEAYINGKAGERFCIRNSGLNAVVEGVGDHGCEYMTGGRVAILGETGRNFGAGMSGGVAYVYDENKTFKKNCNMSMIELEELEQDDLSTLHMLLHNHVENTGSKLAEHILKHFDEEVKKFVKVMPIEYKRILETKKVDEKLGISEVS